MTLSVCYLKLLLHTNMYLFIYSQTYIKKPLKGSLKVVFNIGGLLSS